MIPSTLSGSGSPLRNALVAEAEFPHPQPHDPFTNADACAACPMLPRCSWRASVISCRSSCSSASGSVPATSKARRGLHGGRKEIRADQAVRGQDDSPLDDVFQLPDVAGPRVGQQQRLSSRRNPEPPFAYLIAILFKEVLDEQRMSPATVPGRHRDGNTFSW